MLTRDLHHRPVGLLLVPIEVPEHFGLALIPFGRRELMAAEKLLQSLRVDVERREQSGVSRNQFYDFTGYVFAVFPMSIKPLLKLSYLAATLN